MYQIMEDLGSLDYDDVACMAGPHHDKDKRLKVMAVKLPWK